MVKAKRASAPVSVDAVIHSLTVQGIAFRGPVWTPGEHTVFLIEGHIFLQSELIELLEQNKLNRDAIQELAKRIETHPR